MPDVRCVGIGRCLATSDVGIAKDGTVKDEFARGYALLAKQTILAEGCRGSCRWVVAGAVLLC